MVSNGTNAAATVLAARELTPVGFGAFAATVVSFTITVGGARALALEAALVRGQESGRRLMADLSSAVTAFVPVPVVVLLGAGALVGGSVGACLVAFAACLPGLVLQDAWRYASFTGRRPRAAFASDVAWLVGMVASFGALTAVRGEIRPEWTVLAWAGPGAVLGMGTVAVQRLRLSARVGVWWIRANLDLGGRYLVDFIGTLGIAQVALYALVLISGIAALGGVRAGYALFGPLQVLYVSVMVTLVPDGRRLALRSSRRLVEVLVVTSVILLLVTVAIGVVLSLRAFDPVGELLFGATWPSARDLVVPVCAQTCAGAVLAGPTMGLRALEEAAVLLRIRLYSAAPTLVLACLGAVLGEAPGMVYGLTVGSAGSAAWHWVALRSALARPTVPVAAEGPLGPPVVRRRGARVRH
ncbi:MAG TPA: hypothetical protein VEW93_04970 [Acidimicrobiales bacterium]|nr:hypothetical protein [Acidimicrobiales bacterium]